MQSTPSCEARRLERPFVFVYVWPARNLTMPQLNGHRLEFEWCTQASASAAEVAAPNDRDVWVLSLTLFVCRRVLMHLFDCNQIDCKFYSFWYVICLSQIRWSRWWWRRPWWQRRWFRIQVCEKTFFNVVAHSEHSDFVHTHTQTIYMYTYIHQTNVLPIQLWWRRRRRGKYGRQWSYYRCPCSQWLRRSVSWFSVLLLCTWQPFLQFFHFVSRRRRSSHGASWWRLIVSDICSGTKFCFVLQIKPKWVLEQFGAALFLLIFASVWFRIED